MAEEVELIDGTAGLDEGVAPGSGGAGVAPEDGFAKPEQEVGTVFALANHGMRTGCATSYKIL